MDMLVQVRSEGVQIQGNEDRLKAVFIEATKTSLGKVMHYQQFSDAVRYPLRQSVVNKIYELYFQDAADTSKGLTEEMFRGAIGRLEGRQAFKNILDIYKEPNGLISFESFKDILSVVLMKEGIVICEATTRRLAEIILVTRKETYEADEIEESIQQWEGLKERIRDILSSALFTAPLRLRPSASTLRRSKTRARKSILIWCFITYSVINLLCIFFVFFAGNSMQKSELMALERWNANLSGVLYKNDNFTVSEETIDFTKAFLKHSKSMSANIITELLNLHIFLVAGAGLQMIQIFFKRSLFCQYTITRDTKFLTLVLYSALVGLGITDCVLLMHSRCSTHRPEYLLNPEMYPGCSYRESKLIINAFEILTLTTKYTFLAVYLMFDLCVISKTIIELGVNLSDALYYGFLLLHLIQTSSFLAWSLALLSLMAADRVCRKCYGRKSFTTKIKWCSSTGATILTLQRRAQDILFRPGDFVWLTINGLSGNRIAPSWVISSPSNESEISLLLDCDHWQTRCLVNYLKDVRSAIKDANDKYIKKSLIEIDNASSSLQPYVHRLKKLDNIIEDTYDRPREDAVIHFESRRQGSKRSESTDHRIAARIRQSLYVTLYGPFTGVQFYLYSGYASLMLCVTQKSVGAVANYLEQCLNSESTQKVTLILTASDLSGAEWFVEKLVQLELREGEARNGVANRRAFFRIYLIAVNSRKKAQFLMTSLAIAAMGNQFIDAGGGHYQSTQQCREIIQPALNSFENVQELETRFKDLSMLLCDRNFAYKEQFLCKARSYGADIEVKSF